MPAKQKIPSKQTELDYSIGGFDWVDRDRTLWPMFANLIREIIPDLYRDTLAEQFQTYMELHKAVEKLSSKLPKHSSRKQLALVHAEARKLGLSTTRNRVEAELELLLRSGPRPEYVPLLKASPWPTEFLVQNHIHDQVEALIPVEAYQHDRKQPDDSPYNLRMGNCRMALETVLGCFYFRLERVQEIPSGEGAPVRVETPERLYMARRYAFDAARNMNKFGRGRRDTGPRRLAKFISAFMGKKHWPRQAGVLCDPFDYSDRARLTQWSPSENVEPVQTPAPISGSEARTNQQTAPWERIEEFSLIEEFAPTNTPKKTTR